MNLVNNEEEDFWKQTVLAYLVQGGNVDKGAQFADRAVVALRKRQEPEALDPKLSELERYLPHGMEQRLFNDLVKRAVEDSRSKIPAIKNLRNETGFGIKESKEAVELYAAVYPNPAWPY